MRIIPKVRYVKESEEEIEDEVIDDADTGTEELDTPVDGEDIDPELPNTINITWKLSDDMEEVVLTAISINGVPVEGVEDPDVVISEVAGFSTSLDIDKDILGGLLAQKGLQEEGESDDLAPALIPPAEEQDDKPAVTESESLDDEEPEDELVFEQRYMTKNQNLTEAPVWKWATGQL